MDGVYIALLILAGFILLGGFSLFKIVSWFSKRCYRKMLRGYLREDYIKKNPSLERNGNIICACGGEKIVLRNLGAIEGPDVVREHVCHRCGKRLFFSASGEYLEGIIRELREESGYEEPIRGLAPDR